MNFLFRYQNKQGILLIGMALLQYLSIRSLLNTVTSLLNTVIILDLQAILGQSMGVNVFVCILHAS